MTDIDTGTTPAGPGIRGARRAVATAGADLVTTGFLDPTAPRVPAVFSPSRPGVDLAGWGAEHRELIERELLRWGSVLFRGFGLASAGDFEAAASAIVPDLFGEYGDLPREDAGEKIFKSTPYPPDKMIFFHNESSHMTSWPMRIFFFSAIAAAEGGETPVLDCRAVLEHLDPDVVREFETKGLLYVRNFAPGVDVSWQQFFQTEDRAVVEARCTEAGTGFEWTHGGEQLRIRQYADAVRTHPTTGEKVFFNQVLLHHPAALPPETRASLGELFDDESMPRNARYGDGSVIPDSVVEHLLDVYAQQMSLFAWQQGDILMVDNMLVSHARMPFSGERKTMVAMGRMSSASS